MSGQLTVTLTTLSGGGKKILSMHAVVEEGKRRATGGCQLREREGHHLLRGEQHDCLRLPGLHGAQPSAGSRKSLKRFSTPQRGESTLRVQIVNLSCIRRGAQMSHILYVVLSELCYTKYRRRKEAGEAVLNGGKRSCRKILTILDLKISFTLTFLH